MSATPVQKAIAAVIGLVVVIMIGIVVIPKISRAPSPTGSGDYKNATYIIEGESVTLVNGHAEAAAAPGSASKIVTQYFGNEVKKDLDGDGIEDIAFLVTQNMGGSGTFFYLVGALNKPNRHVGTHAVLIGDRIAPQTVESGPGRQVIVNYADRKPGEPMTAQPSVGKSLYLLLDPKDMQFGEVVQNFEGESNGAPVVGAGEHCGGNTKDAPVCSSGYHCAPTSDLILPFGDVGGTCSPD